MVRSNPTPNPRGFKTIPPAANIDPRLNRTAVGVLTYLLGVDGDTTVTLDALRENARDERIEKLAGSPTLLCLIEGRRAARRMTRALAMLEAAGYVRLERTGRRVEVVEAYERPRFAAESVDA